MFVVRIEELEAVSFRAFRRRSDAAFFAAAAAREGDVGDVDLFELPGLVDPEKAVIATRYGYGTLVASGARLLCQERASGATFMAGMSLGTGAGF